MKIKITTLFLVLNILGVACATIMAQSTADYQPLIVGKSPTKISLELEINAPIEVVWKEFSTIGDIYLNSPTVKYSYVSSDIKKGIGATRHMEMSIKKNATLDERVIKWKEGEYLALDVYKIKGLTGIQTMGGDFKLIPNGNKTILRSTLNYSVTNSFFGVLNKLVLKRKFTKVWKSVLGGYRQHIETQEHITEKTKINTKNIIVIK